MRSTEITVNWDPLPEQYANGRLLGYRVFFQNTVHYIVSYPASSKAWIVNVTNPNTTHVTLTGLKPVQLYRIYVSAFTFKGEGPRTSYNYIKTGATL